MTAERKATFPPMIIMTMTAIALSGYADRCGCVSLLLHVVFVAQSLSFMVLWTPSAWLLVVFAGCCETAVSVEVATK
jgi:hypothetical protein